jgi:hypothetical protein
MLKNLHCWIGSYCRQEIGRILKRPSVKPGGPRHVIFTCCDHYEPDWGGADPAVQLSRVERWVKEYPGLALRHADSDGCHPRHSFFYPAEVYSRENCGRLEELVRRGFGEVDIHLHHDGDTEETLAARLRQAKDDFARHGFLARRRLSGPIRFAFIHGNWSLNNSRSDGKWCGVNDELRVLQEQGCYADFTYPSAPSETQPKMINSIYYASSSPKRPKGHNTGTPAKAGKFRRDHLLMVQGPLTLNWKNRTRGIFPRIENSDLTGRNPPSPGRADLWVKQHISVRGRPDWIFIKTHTHGAREDNASALLGAPMESLFKYLEARYNDGVNFKLHYASAREMYNMIKAAEAGEDGQPGDFRDYIFIKNASG